MLPGVGRPKARAPATEPPTSGREAGEARQRGARGAPAGGELAVCKGPVAAKPSAWASTGPVQRVDGWKRSTPVPRACGWRPEGSGGRRRGFAGDVLEDLYR